MIDFEVGRCTRRCCISDRELQPGEDHYSAIVRDGAEVIRLDYAIDSWSGPPENVICWWKGTIADPKSNKVSWAPSDIMLDYLEQLLEDPNQQDVAYVLSLLLIRRKIVRLDDIVRADGGERMLLSALKREKSYQVLVVEPDTRRIQTIQDQLSSLLQTGG